MVSDLKIPEPNQEKMNELLVAWCEATNEIADETTDTEYLLACCMQIGTFVSFLVHERGQDPEAVLRLVAKSVAEDYAVSLELRRGE